MSLAGYSNSPARAYGLAMSETGAVLATMDEGKRAEIVRSEETGLIPPSVVLGELRGDRPIVDLRRPPDISGTGLDWPPCSRVGPNGSARLPIAMAWPLVEHEAGTWSWQPTPEREATIDPARAIAEASIAAYERARTTEGPGPMALVVPDTLGVEAQDSLLRAIRARGLNDASLLWRPIAAALSWLEKYGGELPKKGGSKDKPIGSLWVIHLGIDAFEITQLELIRISRSAYRYLVPARRLPSLPTLYGEGLRWAETLTANAIAAPENAGKATWNLLWTTNWLRQLAKRLADAASDDHAAVNLCPIHGTPDCKREIERWESLVATSVSTAQDEDAYAASAISFRESFAALSGPYRRPDLSQHAADLSFDDWLDRVNEKSSAGQRILGCIGTGTFAGARIGKECLTEVVFGAVTGRHIPRSMIVEGRDVGLGHVLAVGAAIYASRRAQQLPTYLDTLPDLQLQIVREGEPVWQGLLETKDRYVDGGRDLHFEPDGLDLKVAKEETSLELPVWREGHDTVRTVETTLPQPVPDDTPVKLRIEMRPGQGNPRVEVVQDDAHKEDPFGGRRVYIDWGRSDDTGQTKEEYLDQVPRTNPPLAPRLASLTAWQGGIWGYDHGWHGCAELAQRVVDGIDRLSRSRLEPLLKELRDSLRTTDPGYADRRVPEHATAVSSDGELHAGALESELLDRLTSKLDSALGDSKLEDVQPQCIQILGSCSASTPRLMRLLRRRLTQPHLIKQEHLWAFGSCLRAPRDIRTFAEAMATRLASKSAQGHNNWLRALSRILQYRSHATEDLETRLCLQLTRRCADIMSEEISRGTAYYIYRHASLCVVYLLRRRRFDDSFLDPESQLARRVKKTFRTAISDFKDRKLKKIGGFVNLPQVTRMMIDYIDRRGRGRLVGLSVT